MVPPRRALSLPSLWLRAERVEREQRSGEWRSSLKRLFAHLDELMGKKQRKANKHYCFMSGGEEMKGHGLPL